MSAGADAATPLFIEGYAGQLSVAPGEEVSFHVSSGATKFEAEIVRLGAENETVWIGKDLPGQAHPIPENASSHGCQWPESFRVTVPAEWRSGYYHVVFRASDGGGKFTHRGRRTAESSAYFVVRPAAPGQNTKILLQLTTNTYNAYNNWGGLSLYAYNGRAGVQGNRVSFDRPGGSQFSNWELPFVQWAERNGYTLDFAVNSDLEFRPELLENYRLVLSVGHDEYWSTPMRDHLEAFIAKGGNVAFFSGNTCCWQVRSEDAGRALVCWKENYFKDPVFATGDYTLLTTLWSHHLVRRPENQLTGVGFLWGGFHKSHDQFMDGSGALTVHRPEHWIFEGTGLKRGDEFGGENTIAGYECDGAELEWRDGLPYPTHRDGTPESFTVLCTAPARWHPGDSEWYERWEKGRTGAACLGLYTSPGGGTVFTSGTTDWAHGLRGGTPEVERITKNILDRLSK
ncbi:MAG: hypothetical protein KF886_24025 [Candidatus Hydrogenedentes bacterium]|nr:hypothetical protein [Candidatus Hydrogenedentota bacterium]